MFGGCGTRTSLRASPPRSSIASGSSNVSVRVCLRENPRKRCCVSVLACVSLCTPCTYVPFTLVFKSVCVRARVRVRVRVCSVRMPAHVCARNRAYVTAWLGAQIQRAQLAHRTSRRIVLILRLHSRGVETATSRLLPRATGRLCFKAERSYTLLGS